MPADRPNNPESSCAYCRAFSVGTPTAEELVCGCETDCGAARCDSHTGQQSTRFTTTSAQTPTEVESYDPHGPQLRDAEQDRVGRWNPHPAAVRHARALLAAEPEADLAVIPMFQPGKVRGWWVSGQRVHTVHGVVLLSQNTFRPTGRIPSHSWVRDLAATIAADRLRAYAAEHPEIRAEDGGIGTVAWATVRRDTDHTPVFEDIALDEEDR